MISGAGMSMCMACLAVTASFPSTNESASIASAIFIFLFNSFYPFGFLGGNFLYCTEVAPVRLRVAMNSVSTANHWLWNFVVTMVTPVALDTIGFRVSFSILLLLQFSDISLLKDEIDIKQLSEDAISLNGRVITLLSTRDIAQLNWHKLGVAYVLECTGKFTRVDQAVRHITEAQCKKVVISAPSADAPTFVYGVNSEDYHNSAVNHVISAASCTTNCVTPILKALNDSLGVSQAFLTTVHAATQSQNILDGYSKKNRRLGKFLDSNGDDVLPH